jgi:FAD:protein FMN transferase
MKWRNLFWFVLAGMLMSACNKEPLYQEQGYVFGTLVEVSIYGVEADKARQAVATVMQEFQRLHDLLNTRQPSSLSDVNSAFALGKSTVITPEIEAILREATQLSQQSEGLFNPAIGGLVKLWGFHADEFRPNMPDAKEFIAWVAAKPSMSDISFKLSSEKKIAQVEVSSKNRRVQLDLGGYAKGYALDRAVALLKQQGIAHALVNIGGNVIAQGTHGARAWRVGIQHPRKPGPMATLALHDGEAIGTSGDYQRYFELDGKRYCHLIDPRNGLAMPPVQAVTILTRGEHAGVKSDASSKPVFLAGLGELSNQDAWRSAADKMNLQEVLLIDNMGVAHVTAAMNKRLEFTDTNMTRKIAP